MNLNELKYNEGARSTRKRIGRGLGSGNGKTAGKGHKGQNARSGGGVAIGFEGGQTPIYKRIPKRGFTNGKFRTRYAVINLKDLNVFENGTLVTPALLKEKGIIKNQLDGIKILGEGKLEKNLTIQAKKFSTTALEKIKESGSKAEVI